MSPMSSLSHLLRWYQVVSLHLMQSVSGSRKTHVDVRFKHVLIRMWSDLPDHMWRQSASHCVLILCRYKCNPHNIQTFTHTTLSSHFDLWPLRHHPVLHWTAWKLTSIAESTNPPGNRSLCSLTHRVWLTVVAFTVTTNESAADSVSCLFFLLMTEKRHKWPLPHQRKRKSRPCSGNISAHLLC